MGYAELNAQANRLAHLLIAHGIGAEDLVALAIPRSIEAVVAMLAVAKSGAAYLPLDPEYPPRRIASMLAVARPRLLLTTGEGTRSAADATTPAVPLDDPRTIATLEAQPATHPTDCDRRRPLCPASPVYVTFTSGTTGVPKGIVTTHANLAALVLDGCWRSSGQQRILAHSPQAFDATTYEVWVPLASGGQVVLPPPGRFDLRTAAAAMETLAAPTCVVERTSLATAKERWKSLCSSVPSVPADSAARAASFSWPRICGSPSTMESKPEATRNTCRTACSLGNV